MRAFAFVPRLDVRVDPLVFEARGAEVDHLDARLIGGPDDHGWMMMRKRGKQTRAYGQLSRRSRTYGCAQCARAR